MRVSPSWVVEHVLPWIAAAIIYALWMWFAVWFFVPKMTGQDLPQSKPFPQALIDRNPFFAPATFAKNLYIANVAHLPEGDIVTVASSVDPLFKLYVSNISPSEDGYSIVKIEWSDAVCQTRVTLAKGGQVASIGFLSFCYKVMLDPQEKANYYLLRSLMLADPNE